MEEEQEPELTWCDEKWELAPIWEEELPQVTLPKPLWQQELDLQCERGLAEKALSALHIVACKQIAELDPKSNGIVPTRFCDFNIALFNLDEESEAIPGPPIKEMPSYEIMGVGLSVNVASLKVIKSDVGYPIRVFGTVLARDEVDYKCVYIFRRERDDAQLINSPEDALTLTGPRRAFVVTDSMFFEINLKIKGATGIAEGDFSKGVIEHRASCWDNEAMTWLLTSWRSTVELVCTPAQSPAEATLEVKILNGPHNAPFNGKVIAWADGYEENPMILYEYDGSEVTGTQALIRNDGRIALARNLVAVDGVSAVLNVCFVDSHDENLRTLVDMQYPCEEKVCKHGSFELQLNVAWTAILYKPRTREIQERWFSVPQKCTSSWLRELEANGSDNVGVSFPDVFDPST